MDTAVPHSFHSMTRFIFVEARRSRGLLDGVMRSWGFGKAKQISCIRRHNYVQPASLEHDVGL